MTRGWHNEPGRHSLAARGIKTKNSQNQKGVDDYYNQQPSCKRCGAFVGSVEADIRNGKNGYYKCPKCGWAGNEYIPYSTRGIKITTNKRNKARKIGREFAHRFSSVDSLVKYGLLEASKKIEDEFEVFFFDPEHHDIMENFYEGFEEEGKKIKLPKTKSQKKQTILKLIDDGYNDISDIDAALYEVDFHDEIDELVRDEIIEERHREHTISYYKK